MVRRWLDTPIIIWEYDWMPRENNETPKINWVSWCLRVRTRNKKTPAFLLKRLTRVTPTGAFLDIAKQDYDEILMLLVQFIIWSVKDNPSAFLMEATSTFHSRHPGQWGDRRGVAEGHFQWSQDYLSESLEILRIFTRVMKVIIRYM